MPQQFLEAEQTNMPKNYEQWPLIQAKQNKISWHNTKKKQIVALAVSGPVTSSRYALFFLMFQRQIVLGVNKFTVFLPSFCHHFGIQNVLIIWTKGRMIMIWQLWPKLWPTTYWLTVLFFSNYFLSSKNMNQKHLWANARTEHSVWPVEDRL